MSTMNTIYRMFALTLYGLLIANGLHAVDENNNRSLEFFTLAWSGQVEGLKYQPTPNENVSDIRVNSRYLNGPYNYYGPSRLVFFEETTSPDGSMVRQPKAYFDTASDTGKVILLFTPNQAGSYRVFAININPQNFAAGSYRFINLSPREVAIKLGDDRHVIKSASQEVVLPGFGDRQRFSAQMAAPSHESGWELIFSTDWTHQKRKRVLVFFYEDDSGKVQVKVQPV